MFKRAGDKDETNDIAGDVSQAWFVSQGRLPSLAELDADPPIL
jgi:hypothetical protein